MKNKLNLPIFICLPEQVSLNMFTLQLSSLNKSLLHLGIVFLFLFPVVGFAQACGAVASIIISEVGPRTSNDPSAEYFELYNTTNLPINLTGWVIADESGSSPYTINSSNGTVIIPAGGFLIFSYGNGFNTTFSPATTNHVYGATDATGGSTMTMSSCGDGIEISCNGTQISDFYWSSPSCPARDEAVQTTSIPTAIANGGVITNNNYTLTSPSPGGAGTGQTLLPVQLLNFTGKNMEDHIYLSWKTSIEINNKGFFLQRSNDSKTWESLDFIAGHGSSDNLLNYNYSDLQPLIGINYYRLQQVDFDGANEYSDVIAVNTNNTATQIYPNPVQDQLFIHNTDQQRNAKTIQVFDLSGHLIINVNMDMIEKNHAVSIPTVDLNSGMYFMKISYSDEFIELLRFVKK